MHGEMVTFLDDITRHPGDIQKDIKGLGSQLQRNDKITKDLAKGSQVLEQTFKMIDAEANSASTKLFEFRKALATTHADVAKKLGASSDSYVRSIKQISQANMQRFAKRINNLGGIMESQMKKLESVDPKVLTMAFQRSERLMIEETSRFVTELESVIERLATTPEMMIAAMRGEMAGAGLEIMKVFGAGLDPAQFASMIDEKLTQFEKGLTESQKTISARSEELAEKLGTLAKTQETYRKSVARSISSGGGVGREATERIMAVKDIDAEKLLKQVASAQKVDDAEKIKKALAPIQEKANKEFADAFAANNAILEISNSAGLSTASRMENELKKLEKKSQYIELTIKQKESGSTSDKERLSKEKEKINTELKEDLGVDKMEQSISDLDISELKARIEEQESQAKGLKDAIDNFVPILSNSLANLANIDPEAFKKAVAGTKFEAIPVEHFQKGIQSVAKQWKEWTESAEGQIAGNIEHTNKLRELLQGAAVGKQGIKYLAAMGIITEKVAIQAQKLAGGVSRIGIAVEASAQEILSGDILITKHVNTINMEIRAKAEEGMKIFKTAMEVETGRMKVAAAEAKKIESLEKAFGDIGLPIERFRDKFLANLEQAEAAVESLAVMREQIPKTAQRIVKSLSNVNFSEWDDKKILDELKKDSSFAAKDVDAQQIIIDKIHDEFEKGGGKINPEQIGKILEAEGIAAVVERRFGKLNTLLKIGAAQFETSDVSKSLEIGISGITKAISLAEFGGIDAPKAIQGASAIFDQLAEKETKFYQDRLADLDKI